MSRTHSPSALSPAQCCTPTSSDETLALLSLPISQLKMFASLSPRQQQQLLQLSAKSPLPVASFRSLNAKLTVSAKRRSDESASILRSAKLDIRSADCRSGGRANTSHTAPTSPRDLSASSSASRTPAGLPPFAPHITKHSAAPPHVASPHHSQQPSTTWAASYSFQPPNDANVASTAAPAAEEPDVAASFLPSHLTYMDAKRLSDSDGEATEEAEDATPPAITYLSRLSLDTRTPVSSSATASQLTTPRNDNKFGLKLALGSGDVDSCEAGTPIALFSPQNDNKFGLKLNFSSHLGLDSPSSAFSPAASPMSVIPVSAGSCAAVPAAVAPLPFMSELRDAARSRKHRKGQLSYELTEGGTLLAGGYEINSKGVMRTPNFRPSVSGGQAINLLDGVPALSTEHRSSVAGPSSGSDAALSTTIPSTSTSPSNQSPNSSVLLGESLELSDLVRLSELGAGASGTVVKALHLPSLRLLALKTVSVFSQTDRHQLVKELNGFSTASGPNILRFVGACFAEGSCVMALELMNRGSLEGLVKRYGRVRDEGFLRSMVRQVMLGLSQLAKLHCVHRDIKLANLLMNSDGVCKLADFGLLRQLDGTQDMCSTFLGTMAFLSPERITGDTYTTKSDVWSTGISIVYLVKGELSMPTEYWSLLSIVNSAAPSLTTADGASDLLCDFVRCCLQKDPAERWSADQLLAHPWMTAEKLPSNGASSVWPVCESIDPDADELDKIVDAVIAHYYRDLPYTGSEADLDRARQLARQLGCDVSIVDETFRARFAPTPTTTTSPSLAATITYKPPSTLHSRLPSASPLTMADERQHDDVSASHANPTGRRLRGLSATLGSALSMSQLIQQRMQQQHAGPGQAQGQGRGVGGGVDGYDVDSPLNGSAAGGLSLLASLRDAIATDAVVEEAGQDEEPAGSCINYAAAYPSYPC